jgi:hypothetical protein
MLGEWERRICGADDVDNVPIETGKVLTYSKLLN